MAPKQCLQASSLAPELKDWHWGANSEISLYGRLIVQAYTREVEMSTNGSRLILRGTLLLVAITVLAAATACGSRAFPTGIFHLSGEPQKTMELKTDGNVVLFEQFGTGTSPIEQARTMYRVSGNQVVFEGGTGCDSQNGTYTWSFDGKTLKFTLVSDSCYDRSSTFGGAEFLKE